MSQFYEVLEDKILSSTSARNLGRQNSSVTGEVVETTSAISSIWRSKQVYVNYNDPTTGEEIINVKAVISEQNGTSAPIPKKGDRVLLSFPTGDVLSPVITAVYEKNRCDDMPGNNTAYMYGI